MKRMLRLLPLVLLCAAHVQAQPIPIHQHPQKAFYASPAEMPTDSGQHHWLQRNGVLGHTHVDFVQFPRYGEISGVLTVHAILTLFHTDAQIIAFYAGHWNHDDHTSMIWDATGTETAPVMIGDPMGVKTWGVTFTVAPNMLHGWDVINGEAITQFSDGATTATRLAEPIYSTADLTIPEQHGQQGDFPALIVQGRATSAQFVNNFYGNVTAQYNDMLPLAPISAPWVMPLTATYAYGGRDIERETTELRLDLDLHHGINGTELFNQVTPVDFTNAVMTFDPAQTGPGLHKFALMRNEFNDPEQSTVLLVTFVSVDPSAPPPACAPPIVLKNNQCVDLSVPVVTPPPPPPPPPVPTILNVTTCTNVTFSDGTVTSDCMHRP